jgi:hypothetical protein
VLARWPAFFLALVLFFTFLPIWIMKTPLYDRYVTPYVSVAVVALLSVMTLRLAAPSTLGLAIGGGCAAVFLTFGVFATHDLLRLNQARWDMLNAFVREGGVDPSDIDGGYEYNNYRRYVRDYPRRPSVGAMHQTYLVSLSVGDNDELILRQPTPTWMPYSPRSVYLVKPRR